MCIAVKELSPTSVTASGSITSLSSAITPQSASHIMQMEMVVDTPLSEGSGCCCPYRLSGSRVSLCVCSNCGSKEGSCNSS